MKQSRLFTKTRKEAPKDELAKNAQLLIRAGFIHKEMAGVYSYLPLGLRVIKKIEEIVRREMNEIGGVELQTTALQKKEVWEKTNRWDDAVVDNWFKTKLKNGTELGLGFTQEEPLTNLMTNFISSYKNLPVFVYDFRTVFRNEERAKSGLIRGREFYWKALYSFSKNENEHNVFYARAQQAYQNIFEKTGLGEITFLTFASGGTFSKYSHEYQTIAPAGEDTIYLSKEKRIAVNQEVYTDEVLSDLGLAKDELTKSKAIEVGNIFPLHYRFSEPFGLQYKDEKGEKKLVFMGSYGLGISRLLGTIVETLSDEKGIVWPASVAPFKIHLLSLGQNEKAEEIYKKLKVAGAEVLYDDRDITAGEKFAEADLIGLPYRAVVSEKTVAAGGAELKRRNAEKSKIVGLEELIKLK
ncbi:MAG: prolyl-tRNA synthetase [Candidatus Pacebacteria bacterium]|nr:prolyl-tRNA synthetase [Candidatus Paceibacterota bacterium]